MSGHNKWSQIKRKKGKEDARKGKLFSLLGRQITLEMKKSGSKDAPGVKAAIDRARKENMPNDNINRAITKGTGANAESYEEVMYEAYGPGGAALILEGITDNKNRTVQELRHLLSEHGGNLGATGSTTWAFSKVNSEWQPNSPLKISDADQEKLYELIEKLEDHQDIKKVFTNEAGFNEID